MSDYNNPIPVAVVMLRIEGVRNFLLVKRSIEPFIGKYALPGGYVNEGEDASTAASRELKEETGIHLVPGYFIPIQTKITPNNQLLIFMKSSFILEKYWYDTYKFSPNNEVSSLQLSKNIHPNDIAFPLHREAIQRY